MSSRFVAYGTDSGQASGGYAATSVDALMKADGETFVRWAYITLLGRMADPVGIAFYLAKMEAGKSKISILKQLSLSSEGRAYGAQLPGLHRAILNHRIKSAPIVGPVYRWLLGGR
ncbi:MAG: DUF4214 domain-containing protein [bacterium]|nr:DUF4214 domain-containing protein [bacterium]